MIFSLSILCVDYFGDDKQHVCIGDWWPRWSVEGDMDGKGDDAAASEDVAPTSNQP